MNDKIKLGVYFPFNRALFGRLGMAQLRLQTRKPDYLVMCPNGDMGGLMDSLVDYTSAIYGEGTDVTYISQGSVPISTAYRVPLTQLLGWDDCQWFIKWDQDDMYRDNFLEKICELISRAGEQHDWVAFARNGALVEGKAARYIPHVEWGNVNSLGAASTCLAFNRRVALAYALALLNFPNSPDDVVLKRVLSATEGLLSPETAPYVHVSHGENASTKAWIKNPPTKVFG